MSEMTIPPRATLIIIGDEILSGKIQDENTPFLSKELFEMGWQLVEIVVIGDVPSQIVSTLERVKKHSDHIFTSGGLGPTHDDKTLEAVAKATERRLVSSPMLEKILKTFYRVEALSPAQQRLALIPEGCTLHYGPDSHYPQVIVDKIYPLPGIPKLFRKKFRELKDYWPEYDPLLRSSLKMIADETDLAAVLSAISEEHPEVKLGSYPTEREGQWHLELVLESRSLGPLAAAVESLKKVLSGRDISWDETPPPSR